MLKTESLESFLSSQMTVNNLISFVQHSNNIFLLASRLQRSPKMTFKMSGLVGSPHALRFLTLQTMCDNVLPPSLLACVWVYFHFSLIPKSWWKLHACTTKENHNWGGPPPPPPFCPIYPSRPVQRPGLFASEETMAILGTKLFSVFFPGCLFGPESFRGQ